MATNPFDQYDAPAKNPFDEFDDTPAIAAAPGFAATAKRTAGQMLTSTARAIDDVTGPNSATAAAREYGQGVIDRNPAGIQSIGDIAASPTLAIKEATGNVATQVAVNTTAAAGMEALGRRFAGPAGAAAGRVIGGYLPMFAQEYGSVRDEQIEGGRESIPRALGAATAATALERVGPDGRIIFKGLKNPVERTVKQVAGQAGRDVLVEGATEGAQTVVEQLGAFKDPRTAENLGETALSTAMGGIGGGVAGGAHAAASSLKAGRSQPDPQTEAPQTAEQPPVESAAPVEPVEPVLDTQAPAPAVAPAPGDPLRATKLPEAGPLSRGINTLIEGEAQAADAGTPVQTPVTGALAGVPAEDAAPKIPVGEATEVEQIPAGEATELPADQVQPAAGPTFDPATGEITQPQRATFPTREAVDEYLRQARLQQGGERAKAAPVELPDGTFSFLRPNEPGYDEALTESKQTVLQRKRAAAAKVKAEAEQAKPPSVLQQRRAEAAATRDAAGAQADAAAPPVAPAEKPVSVLQQRRAAAAATRERADAAPVAPAVKAPNVLQQRRAAAAAAKTATAPEPVAPVTKSPTVLQQRRAAALAAKQNAGAPAADTGALGSASSVATPPTAPAPTADDTNQPRRVSTEAQAPADQAQPPARGDGATRVAEPAVAGPAAVQADGVAPDLAGKKIDKEWTAFAPDSGTKGVPRADMPQIKAEHRGAMTQFLGARGITHEQAEVPAADLKPTQAEFSTKKVRAARDFSDTDRSILVSSDGHILDGHHQWLAARDAGKTVKVIRLDAPIDKLLAEVKEFPSAGAAQGATDKTSRTLSAPARSGAGVSNSLQGFAQYGAGPAERDLAERQAEAIVGVRFPVKRSGLNARVPALFRRTDAVVLINRDMQFSQAGLVEVLAEEFMHGVDSISPSRIISGSAKRLMPAGDIRQEVEAHFSAQGEFADFLAYPLHPIYGLEPARVRAELFARLALVYRSDARRMQAALPITYEAYHEFFSQRSDGRVREVPRPVQPAGRAGAGVRQDRGESQPAAPGAEALRPAEGRPAGGAGQRQADSRLLELRRRAVDIFNGRRDGAFYGGGLNSAESFDIGDQPAKPDTAAYGPASQAHRDVAAELQQRLRATFPGVVLDAVAPRVDTGGTGGGGRGERGVSGEREASIVEVAKRLFKREVIYVKFDGPSRFNGAVSDAFPGKIFLSVDSEKPLMAVLGHELIHSMRGGNPAMYEALKRRLTGLLKNEQQYIDKLDAKYAARGVSSAKVRHGEELHADIVGDFFMDPVFWQDMAKDKPGLFRRIATAIIRFLDNTAKRITNLKPFGSEEYLADIAAARSAVATTLREFSEAVAPDASLVGSGIDFSLAGGNPAGRGTPAWVNAGGAALQTAAGKIDTYAPAKPIGTKLREMSAGWKGKIVQGMFDAYAPLKELSMDAYIAARMTKSADGAFEGLMMYGKPEMAANGGIVGNLDGKGFLGFMKELNGEHDRFFMWLAGNRAGRLMSEDRERLFTAEEIAAMRGLNAGQMADGSSRVAAFKRAHDQFNAYSKSVLDVAEKSGLIDGESRKLWEQDFYVPFYRVGNEAEIAGPAKIKGLARQKAFEKLKGGKENLGDLMENTLRNWSHLLSASLANVAASKSLQAAERAGVALEAKEATAKEMAKAAGIKGNATYFMDQGQQRWFVVEDAAVLQAVSALEAPALSGLPLQIMGKFKKYLTVGVTISPAFKVRNLIRDTLSAPAANEMGYNVAKNLAQGWKGTNTKTDAYAQMLFSGALMKFGTYLEGDRAENVKRLIASGVDSGTILNTPQKVKAGMAKAWDAWQDFGDRLENVNRTALYQQLIDKGLSPRDAAFQARDMMDFSLQGSWAAMRTLAAVVPFMNARLQGLYKLGRAAKQDPKRMGYMVAAVSLASIALMLANQDDDDWKAREDWDRDAFWWIKIGGTAFRIPKPFELGAMGTIAERSVELLVSDEMTGERFAERMKQMVLGTFAMNPVPQLFKPMIDLYANKDSFTGRQIETMGMERLSKGERYGPNTSALAKALGSAGDYTGLSPVQIDHMVRAYFGWLGVQGLTALDVITSPLTDKVNPAMRLDDFTAGFVKELPAAQSRYMEDFYKQARATAEAMADLKRAREAGDTEKVAEIMEDKGDTLARRRLYQHAEQQMSGLNKRIRQVRESTHIDSESKREQIDALTASRNRLAKLVSDRTRSLEAAH